MPLFYPKWTGLENDNQMNPIPKVGVKKTKLFSKSKSLNADPSELISADLPQAPIDQPEDSAVMPKPSLFGRDEKQSFLFKGQAQIPEPMGEKLSNEVLSPGKEMPVNKPVSGKLFGSRSVEQQVDEYGLPIPQKKKIGGIQEFLSNFIPGVQGRYGASEEYNDAVDNYVKLRKLYDPEQTTSEKDFAYYSKLDPESQRKYLEMKAAGAIVGQPFQQQKADRDQANKNRDDERSFRQDFLNNDTTKSYNQAVTGFKKIEETFKSKDPTGFSDQALIFNFNKVMDPGSVVREGEYNATMKNAALFDQFGISVQKILSGQKLSPEMRQKLYETAKLQMKANQDRFAQFRDEQLRIARDYGYDTSRVIPDIEYKNEDDEALEWAKQNQNDPRAKEILKINGVQ